MLKSFKLASENVSNPNFYLQYFHTDPVVEIVKSDFYK